MKNADKPINPCMMQQVGENDYRASKGNDPKEWNVATEGLTKREYFAGKAMQGLLSSFTEKSAIGNWKGELDEVAKTSIVLADELLSALANES